MPEQQRFFDPPADDGHTLSRRTDPETSHEAARSLPLGDRMTFALSILTLRPGSTASELDAATLAPSGTVRKRLNDLRKRGLAKTDGTRTCRVTGKRAQVWRPV